MKTFKAPNSQVINGIALGFSLSFFAAAWAGAVYTGEWGQVFYDWYLILVSPCPLVTDYFCLGGLCFSQRNFGYRGLYAGFSCGQRDGRESGSCSQQGSCCYR